MELLFDPYTRRARIAPLLLTALPLPLTLLVLAPFDSALWSASWGLIVWCGGTLLLSELGRDLGKKKEPKLYELWGGPPTTRLLRHRENPNPVQLQQRHEQLARAFTVTIPSAEQEEANPEQAEPVYETLVSRLRGATRDRKRFPLVFAELCSYGFRRNLLGLKPIGLAVTAISLLSVVIWSVPHIEDPGTIPQENVVVVVVLGILMLLWIFWVTPAWVRIPAEAYAERLFEAIPAVANQ